MREERNRYRFRKPRLLQLNTEIKLKAFKYYYVNESYRQANEPYKPRSGEQPPSNREDRPRPGTMRPQPPPAAVGSKPPSKHQPPVFLTHGHTLVFTNLCAYDAPSGKVPHIHHICIPIDSEMGTYTLSLNLQIQRCCRDQSCTLRCPGINIIQKRKNPIESGSVR